MIKNAKSRTLYVKRLSLTRAFWPFFFTILSCFLLIFSLKFVTQQAEWCRQARLNADIFPYFLLALFLIIPTLFFLISVHSMFKPMTERLIITAEAIGTKWKGLRRNHVEKINFLDIARIHIFHKGHCIVIKKKNRKIKQINGIKNIKKLEAILKPISNVVYAKTKIR